jgi:hypothetical protein
MNKKLHIVCLDVPYPADHGGMFDLFYKIVALQKTGTEIILHCFEYGKGKQDELKKYCCEVHYYKRKTGLKGFSFSLPYIVSSRINKQLFERLQEDNLPILLEGTHTTYLAYKNLFPDRTVLFRLHNIEQIYYHHLFKSETSVIKKNYYRLESWLLTKYERTVFRKVSFILPVSEKDAGKISKEIQKGKVKYLPVFLPFGEVNILQGIGEYCLYHGNLSVAENDKAVRWLANNIDKNSVKLIIAGKNASASLKTFLKNNKISLIANPSNDEMNHLIQNAQINIVLSFNDTGIKIKLLNALFHGRHCVVNEASIPGKEFESLCKVFASPTQLNEIISHLKNKSFNREEIDARTNFLLTHFDNETNAEKLNAIL